MCPSAEKIVGYIGLHTLDLQRAFACASGAGVVLTCKGWGVTASQLNLPYMMPLSVAGCGRVDCNWEQPIGLHRYHFFK